MNKVELFKTERITSEKKEQTLQKAVEDAEQKEAALTMKILEKSAEINKKDKEIAALKEALTHAQKSSV